MVYIWGTGWFSSGMAALLGRLCGTLLDLDFPLFETANWAPHYVGNATGISSVYVKWGIPPRVGDNWILDGAAGASGGIPRRAGQPLRAMVGADLSSIGVMSNVLQFWWRASLPALEYLSLRASRSRNCGTLCLV